MYIFLATLGIFIDVFGIFLEDEFQVNLGDNTHKKENFDTYRCPWHARNIHEKETMSKHLEKQFHLRTFSLPQPQEVKEIWTQIFMLMTPCLFCGLWEGKQASVWQYPV